VLGGFAYRGFAFGACALAALLLLATPQTSQAELIGEFNARLKNVRAWGAYTAVLESRVYETDGSPPPDLATATVHFPRGAALRERFLTNRFFCDPETLRVEPDPKLCRHAHFGSGKLLLDARPWIEGAIPADVELFLGRGTQPEAIASAVVLVKSNQYSHAYDFQVLHGSVLRDAGGFGYRLELPTAITPRLPGLKLRLAELELTIRGLRIVDGDRRLFWTRTPGCDRNRKLTFGADYAFEQRVSIVRRRKISCRRFLRRPESDRKSRIPGAP
jgi:hypothetical protein